MSDRLVEVEITDCVDPAAAWAWTGATS